MKVSHQYYSQIAIKTNFGHAYPYYSRLLNYYPFLFITYFIILWNNVNGLFWYGFTNTAFLLQNFLISFQIIFGLTLLSIVLKFYRFYEIFVPSGVPLLLLPFLSIIEIISHIAKMFSLAIRLFANMMSGHILLHILLGFVLILVKINLGFTVAPLIVIFFIIILEFGLAFLQAFVFLTLSSIYFEELLNLAKEDKKKLSSICLDGHEISTIRFQQLFTKVIGVIPNTYDIYFVWVDKPRRDEGRRNRNSFWETVSKAYLYAK